MALNFVAVLPPLFSAQKILEDYTIKYGTHVYLDPANDTSNKKKPSAQANITNLSKMAEYFIMYYNIKVSILNDYKGLLKNAVIYFILGLLILISSLGVFGFVIIKKLLPLIEKYNELTKSKKKEAAAAKQKGGDAASDDKEMDAIAVAVAVQSHEEDMKNPNYMSDKIKQYNRANNYGDEDGDDEAAAKKEKEKEEKIPLDAEQIELLRQIIVTSVYGIIVLLLWIYTLIMVVLLFMRSRNQYDVSCENSYPRLFLNLLETDAIGALINLFYISKIKNNTIYIKKTCGITVDKNAIAYAYQKTHPNITIADLNTKSKSKKKKKVNVCLNENKTEDNKNVKKEGIFNEKLEKSTFPALGGAFVLDAFDLKKKLQSLDPIEQMNRINDGISNLKLFLLAQNDEMYKSKKLTNEIRKNMNDKIVQLFTSEYSIVSNLKPMNGEAFLDETMRSCFKKINSDDYVSASFDSNNNACYMTKRNDPIEFELNSKVSTLVRNNGNIKVASDKVNKGIYSTYKQSKCSNEAYCLNENQMPTKTITYQSLYSQPTSEVGSYKLVVPAKDIINSNKNSLPQFYSNMKDWLIETTCKLILDNNMPNTYNFNKADESYITSQIAKYLKNSFTVASGPLLDIFSSIPIFLQKEKDKIIKSNYIPFKRFCEKLQNSDTDFFINTLVYNSEEVRSTSDGLNDINTCFNEPVLFKYENTTKTMQKMTQIFLYTTTTLFLTTRLVNEIIVPEGFKDQLKDLDDKIKAEESKASKERKRITEANLQDVEGEDEEEKKKKKVKALKEVLVKQEMRVMEHEVKKKREIVKFIFKHCGIISITLIIISLYMSYIKKQMAIDSYNKFIQASNGSTFVNSAKDIMNMYYTDIVKNNVYSIKSEKRGSPFAQKSLENDQPDDMMFQCIVQNTNINNDKIKYSPDNNLEAIYKAYVSMIDSFDKCNSLFNIGDLQYPFPIIEMSVYSVIFLMALLALGYLYVKLLPIENIKKVKHVNKLLTKVKKEEAISFEDIPQEELYFKEIQKYDEDNFSSILIGGGAILILSAGITFSILTNSEASRISGVLYGGNLFSKMECYPPNIQSK